MARFQAPQIQIPCFVPALSLVAAAYIIIAFLGRDNMFTVRSSIADCSNAVARDGDTHINNIHQNMERRGMQVWIGARGGGKAKTAPSHIHPSAKQQGGAHANLFENLAPAPRNPKSTTRTTLQDLCQHPWTISEATPA